MARILLIDDEAALRETLGSLIESDGHRVTTAACGKDALQYQTSSPFDLVITDLMMPGEQGFETIMKFRRLWRDLPIVAYRA